MKENSEELEARIAAYIDGELPPAEAARLEVFLANTDPALAQQIIGMIAEKHAVRSLPKPPAPEDLAGVPGTPVSLEEALAGLRRDHDYLLRGDVFTEDVIDTWIWYKTVHEVEALRQRPHPWEFAMYFDI